MTGPITVEHILASHEIVVVCGSGGVGKTTASAALATMAAVHLGGRVLALTVDPARRLASALGLESFGNVESRVPDEAFADAGLAPKGELWAAMLDTKQGWDDLVRRHAPDDHVRDAILANPLYGNITGRFVQSHEYIAMERLYELHTSGRFDLVVVDTPPSRHALDFLDAPNRMAEFFGSRLLKWLTVPYRSRVVTMASKPFYTIADRILGTKFLEDIGEFFSLLRTMEGGFVERARDVTRVLADRRTTFCVVSTLEPAPVHEAEFFIRELQARQLHLGALVLNKVLPPYLVDPGAAASAEQVAEQADALAQVLGPTVGFSSDQVRRVLDEVTRSFDDFRAAAHREAELRAELAARPTVTAAVPYLEDDIHDLAGLVRLGESIWR